MRNSLKAGLLLTVGLVLTTLHAGWVQEEEATYVKGLLCVACHKALNKELVTRFTETKHAKAKPTPAEGEEMRPVDVYRRSVGFVPADNSYSEPGVGCQSCHGLGSKHVGAKDEEKAAAIVSVAKLDTPRKKLSVCGRCHGEYTIEGQPFPAKFKPGMDLFEIEGFQLSEITQPGPFQQLNELQASKHMANDVTCVTCHTAHQESPGEPQLRKPLPDLCLECHADPHAGTAGPAEIPEGMTCATCHMPDGRHVFAVAK